MDYAEQSSHCSVQGCLEASAAHSSDVYPTRLVGMLGYWFVLGQICKMNVEGLRGYHQLLQQRGVDYLGVSLSATAIIALHRVLLIHTFTWLQ